MAHLHTSGGDKFSILEEGICPEGKTLQTCFKTSARFGNEVYFELIGYVAGQIHCLNVKVSSQGANFRRRDALESFGHLTKFWEGLGRTGGLLQCHHVCNHRLRLASYLVWKAVSSHHGCIFGVQQVSFFLRKQHVMSLVIYRPCTATEKITLSKLTDC